MGTAIILFFVFGAGFLVGMFSMALCSISKSCDEQIQRPSRFGGRDSDKAA